MSDTFGFGQNDAGIGGRAQKFKAEKNKTYRLGFVWWPGIEEGNFGLKNLTIAEGADEASLTPKFIRAQRNFIKDVGYVINQGPEWTKLAGEAPKTQIATIIVSWPLGKNGQPTKESLFGDLPEVMAWIFGGDKYEKLKKQHQSGYPMWEWDVQADCEDAGFQKMSFLPAKQCIFREMLKSDSPQAKEIVNHILEQVRALAPRLEREIGSKLTLDQLREKLGQDASSPVGSVVTADADVDNILGNMLDD
jgi:hypothetical protein